MQPYINTEFRELIEDICPEALLADGLDKAILGYTTILNTQTTVIVYSAEKVIETLVENLNTTYEEAAEYADFNVFCAYVGPHTPLFVWTQTGV